MDLISAIQALALARTTYPEALLAQQDHFAATLPAAEARLQELLTEHLGQEERRALLDVLCEIEGLEVPEYEDDAHDEEL